MHLGILILWYAQYSRAEITMFLKTNWYRKNLLVVLFLASPLAFGMEQNKQIIFKEKPLHVIKNSTQRISPVTFSPDGAYFDIENPLLSTWNPTQSSILLTIEHRGFILHDFAHNSEEVIPFSKYKEKESDKTLRKTSKGVGYFRDATFTRDGKKIIAAFAGTLELYVYDIKSKTVSIYDKKLPHTLGHNFKFIEYGKYGIGLDEYNRGTFFIDIEHEKSIQVSNYTVDKLLVSPNQHYFATGTRTHFSHRWDIYAVQNPTQALISDVDTILFTGNGSYVMTGRSTKEEIFFDLSVYPLVEKRVSSSKGSYITASAIDPSGTYLVLGEKKETKATKNTASEYLPHLSIFRLSQEEPILLQTINTSNEVQLIMFSPDGKKLGVSTKDEYIIYESNPAPINITKPRIEKLYNTKFKFK